MIRRVSELPYSSVTPKSVYLNRRRFLASVALGAGRERRNREYKTQCSEESRSARRRNRLRIEVVTNYNNFYEFGTAKSDPSHNAKNFRTIPWTVVIEGAVSSPRCSISTALLKIAPLEERIYRHRCVEAWSIVVPWIGFPLNALIKAANPLSSAKYVAFQSLYDPKQMPQGRYAGIPLPYVEGLRIDEAMHPLALLCVGLYGEVLPNQNGAPIRLVIPWKYGFKSIKSIVKIRFVEKQPPTTWNISSSSEYGFYSNVNPEVDHPRWSQAKERRLGELSQASHVEVQRLRGSGSWPICGHGPPKELLNR